MAPPTARSALRLLSFLLIALTCMELCARIDDRFATGAPMLSNDDFDHLFAFDGVTMRGVPGAHFAKWQLNSIGMRGPEPQPDTGQTRILVYGASEMFGIYETPGQEVPASLARTLQAGSTQRRFEVFNTGIPGMRVGSGVAHLADLGKRLHPAVVIIYPTPTHYIGVSRPNCGRPPRKVKSDPASAWPRSRLLSKSVAQVKLLLPPLLMQGARKILIRRELHDKSALPRIPEASLNAFETDLVCAVDAARAIGAVPILVTHASRFGPERLADTDYWLTGWRAQYPELDEGGFVDLEQRANARVQRIASEKNILLAPADVAVGGQPANFADHAHFNDRGAAQMGALLAPLVLQAVAGK